MRGKSFAIFVCLLVMFFGAQAMSFSGPQEKISDEDKAAITELFDKWNKAWMEEDLETILSFYTEQTVEIYPNQITNVGKANMTRRFKDFLPNYDYKEITLSDFQFIGVGDTAMCCFRAKRTYRYRDAEELTSNQGRSFMILKKIDDTWKIAMVHWIFD